MRADKQLHHVRTAAHALLERHWDASRGYCVPNPDTYPHLWLWDSCFHAIAWAYADDPRGLRELGAVLARQLPAGFVPHMRYGPTPPATWLGPLARISSLTQPPMFGHAARVLARRGMPPPEESLQRCRRGLDWLWDHRRTDDDLIYIVHPWEAGNDHSPRWDDWGAPGRTPRDWNRQARSAWNKRQVADVSFDEHGAGRWSRTFVSCPAGFNAYVAFNLSELAQLTGDPTLDQRARRIAQAMDRHLWNPAEKLWDDQAVVGGGLSVTTPISDGVMGALVTDNQDHALQALGQLTDPDRFGAPWGPANVARNHPAYDPAMYWRGPAWPILNYLFWLAMRRWECDDAAAQLAGQSIRSAVGSGWAEYWNPDTGQGLGAAPQTWTTVVTAMT